MVERAERYAGPIARTVLWIALAALLLLLAGVSLTFAIVFILLGAGIGILGVAGKRSKLRAVVWASTFIRKRSITWVVAAMLGFAGSVGSGVHWARASEQAAQCARARDSATASIALNQFNDARTWLERARANCTATAWIDAAIADVRRQEDAYNMARAAEAAAREAQVAAAIEKQAVDGFPALSKKVNDMLRAVSAKTWQGQWRDADNLRTGARTALDVDTGTSVTGTKEWLDLSAKVNALEQKLQPQLDRIAQAEAARDRQLAAAQERQRQQVLAQEQARHQAAVADPTSLEGAEAIVGAYKRCMATGRASMAFLVSEGHSVCVEHSVRDARCTREAHCDRLDNPALCIDVSAAGLMCP